MGRRYSGGPFVLDHTDAKVFSLRQKARSPSRANRERSVPFKSPLDYIPQGQARRAILWTALFALFLALPFLVGSDRPFADLKRMAAKEGRETLEIIKPNPLAPPAGFNPIITKGPLAVTQVDADRGSWSWAKAKGLASQVWERETGPSYTSFYCGCSIEERGSTGGSVDLSSCGVLPRKSSSRAQRLEWEHIVPASTIAQGKSCWSKGAAQCVDKSGKAFKGRACCEIADPYYNMAATDPVNLVPAVGEINGDRSNYAFGLLPGERRDYGSCDIEIDRKQKLVEPPLDRRGDIARVWAYMSRAYGISVSPEQAKLYQSWISQDPVSPEEIAVNEKIRAAGHRANPFVSDMTGGKKMTQP